MEAAVARVEPAARRVPARLRPGLWDAELLSGAPATSGLAALLAAFAAFFAFITRDHPSCFPIFLLDMVLVRLLFHDRKGTYSNC